MKKDIGKIINQIEKQLDKKSKIFLSKFVNACLKLDFSTVKTLLDHNPQYIHNTGGFIVDETERDKTFADRIQEIFNEFKIGKPTVTVKEHICKGCNYGGKTKLFTVTYPKAPEKTSQFGFYIKIKDKSIVYLHECSQYKSYQDKLALRMYAGKTAEEIIHMKLGAASLSKIKSAP